MDKLNDAYPNVYREDKTIYTKNHYPGRTHFSEPTVTHDGTEYREWDPNRSKLGAAIKNRVGTTGIHEGDTVLYLGSGHGYTPSFMSDMIGDGMIFCLDVAPRVVRDLVYICEARDNMAPLLYDANDPAAYERFLPDQVDVIFQDIAQKNQVEIFQDNINHYLKDGGYALLALKARSIDVNANPDELFNEVKHNLSQDLHVVNDQPLKPYEKDHVLYVCKV